MDTGKLKKFAQEARTQLMAQVAAKMELVLAEGSAARREAPAAVKELLGEIARSDKQQVVEKVAYTWFNRFTALRFMDASSLTNPRVVTPAEGQTRPELLADAAAGHMGETIPEATRNAVAALLDGRTPSPDAQGEAYRLLLVAVCNGWHEHMPFMFEKIRDYTELLMPEDLLSQDSILSRMRAVMADEDCRDVEIIGWLYQFYISEKKDEVFAALKKNVKISAENIPAATQLFTPHWIVRYLVENSLGRLWLLNRPQSNLARGMNYYIAPEEPETDFLAVAKPEDIRICDPACGSGHMLTYAFDLLHAIYEEEGYDAGEIPALILTHNLHGIEIDDRAGALASFALAMKAATKLGRRRFLRLEAKPNICVLQDVRFTAAEIQDVMAVVGSDLFTADLRETLGQFEQAKNFGSLIVPKLQDPAEVARVVRMKEIGTDMLLRNVQERVLKLLEMAKALSRQYHIVVANPPYMGAGSMDQKLKAWSQLHYPLTKSDLFAMFIERALALALPNAWNALVTMEAWMFLTSYSKLRSAMFSRSAIQRLLHLPYEGRSPTAMGISFGVVAFVLNNTPNTSLPGYYSRLRYFDLERDGSPREANSISSNSVKKHQSAFKNIPGQTVAFDASDRLISLFAQARISDDFESGGRCKTSNDELYLRRTWEVSAKDVGLERSWCLLSKGGEFRKFFGNVETVMRWTAEAKKEYSSSGGLTRSEFWGRAGITWTIVSSKGSYSFRLKDGGTQYNSVSPTIFGPNHDVVLAYLNSKVAHAVLKIIAPTLAANVGEVLNLPWRNLSNEKVRQNAERLIDLARCDWDEDETSWDFSQLPLLLAENHSEMLAHAYGGLHARWRDRVVEMKGLEEENNRILINAYELQNELASDVPQEEITLTCNAAYRYGGKSGAEELEFRLRTDTIADLLHYGVGCMFGRYSIDAPGLILANQGEGLADYLARVPNPRFDVDADNVIPMLEGDWFADDITERFRKFLRVTFGEENFQENLAFIEEALGKDIRKWFTKDFFDYHVRRYKKRPIYWMFSSPKGTFNALIYMHRYRPDTISVVLNDYLRELISKLQAERARLEKLADDASVSQAQRTRALKEIGTVVKQIDELTAWERDVIFPLAQAKIEIDLDDGVKANYPKFGAALKPIKGLDAKEDE